MATATATITILADEPSGPATPLGNGSGGGTTPEPNPSASPEPQPSPTPGVHRRPAWSRAPLPSPVPRDGRRADEPGSGAWLWWIGLSILALQPPWADGGIYSASFASRRLPARTPRALPLGGQPRLAAKAAGQRRGAPRPGGEAPSAPARRVCVGMGSAGVAGRTAPEPGPGSCARSV